MFSCSLVYFISSLSANKGATCDSEVRQDRQEGGTEREKGGGRRGIRRGMGKVSAYLDGM